VTQSGFHMCTAPMRQGGGTCSNIALRGRDVCHIHAPERQCGVIQDDGTRCHIATGGKGPCQRHRADTDTAPSNRGQAGA